ncbi:hypothetical protein KXD40_003051 [Peronospora effusa]|uniref:Glucose-6-phosphate 1-epimerase n=1 Tax=Peronospora effusa TaxID=542832 RepID=A0A3M6VQ53_9STRA|nr:hypothetical protein DD238_006256 [Peronospora effusa]RQM11348.1 hypothetical protein DD237_006675 [Peronospora effusa]UIZ29720.1 hypothetical protein KXD40_003051 [Peronospora effusa]
MVEMQLYNTDLFKTLLLPFANLPSKQQQELKIYHTIIVMVYAFILKTAAIVLTLAASAHAETVTLTHPDGSSAEISLFGAHVLSFRAAIEPKLDILFLSKKSSMDYVQPIRGGIPIIFPNFGSREGFPSHGFARTTNWTLISTSDSTGAIAPSVATFIMKSSDATRAIWPVDFELEYEVKLYANDLTTTLYVTNTFTEQIEFHALLHNYLWVDDVRNKGAVVSGLEGVNYFDQVAKVNKTESRKYIDFAAETDNVYRNAPGVVDTLISGINTVQRTVSVEKKASISSTDSQEVLKTETDLVV